MRNLPILYKTRSHVGRNEPSALHWPACVAFCCEVQWIFWWSFIIVNFSLHCNCSPCLLPYCSLPLSIHLYPQCMYGVWHIGFIGLKFFTIFKCYWQVKWDLIIWFVIFFFFLALKCFILNILDGKYPEISLYFLKQHMEH